VEPDLGRKSCDADQVTELFDNLQGGSQWFFAKKWLASFCNREYEIAVGRGGRSDHHRVHVQCGYDLIRIIGVPVERAIRVDRPESVL
jgi:hypothetical protein